MKYKYKIGDKVKIIKSGDGYNPAAIGCVVEILKLGVYCGKKGYQTTIPSRGNSNAEDGDFNYMAGERSFELVSKIFTTIDGVDIFQGDSWFYLKTDGTWKETTGPYNPDYKTPRCKNIPTEPIYEVY